MYTCDPVAKKCMQNHKRVNKIMQSDCYYQDIFDWGIICDVKILCMRVCKEARGQASQPCAELCVLGIFGIYLKPAAVSRLQDATRNTSDNSLGCGLVA